MTEQQYADAHAMGAELQAFTDQQLTVVRDMEPRAWREDPAGHGLAWLSGFALTAATFGAGYWFGKRRR